MSTIVRVLLLPHFRATAAHNLSTKSNPGPLKCTVEVLLETSDNLHGVYFNFFTFFLHSRKPSRISRQKKLHQFCI